MELPDTSPQPIPTSVTQEVALSPPRIKDTPAGAVERYQDVLPLPLAGMVTIWLGRPETIKGGEDHDADAYEGDSQWERHPGSETSAKEE